jgi:hypothetical protein
MRKYADDYEVVRMEDEKGRIKKTAKYVGDYYEVNVEAQDLVRFRRIAVMLLILITGLHVGAGFIGNQGMYRFFVALPYVFVFLPLYYFASGILRLPKEKRPFRRDEVDLSFNRTKKASGFLITLLSLVVVGELIFIVGFAEGGHNLEVLFLVLETLAAGAVAFLWQSQKSITVQKISKE